MPARRGVADPGASARLEGVARVLFVLVLAGTIPLALFVPHGPRIVWTILIALVPLTIVLVGFYRWRRVCPLAVFGQVGRIVGRPGRRKAGDGLARVYLYVQLAVLVFALALRLVATNGTPWALAGFLGLIVLAAVITSFVYTGKTWCNYLCPVGVVEKLYTEPTGLAADTNAQCGTCTACKKHCPDIDAEQGYWKEAELDGGGQGPSSGEARRASPGLWRIHAYRYAPGESTFIVEATEATWRAAGLDRADEAGTIAHLERVFAEELAGHRLIANRSIWRQFPIVRCGAWATDQVVLVGDAAHTAHFSIGSGTKLALEDAIALDAALAGAGSVRDALAAYERERRPVVDSIQRAAQASLEWFEHTERYAALEPLQFAMSLLTRSLRVTHANLRLRDRELVERTERWFAEQAVAQVLGADKLEPPALDPAEAPPRPMLTPFRLRQLVLPNRVVVSPMCQYSAVDGVVGDWHLVHLGSRALGGAGLVMCEMTGVSPDARITPGCAGIWNDAQTAAWHRIVDFAHAQAHAAIGLQLGHAGRKGATCLPWDGGDDRALADGAWPLVAPSPLPWTDANQTPQALTRADMERITADYAAAARRADAAGFDLLEVHAAHGYLLASFLSPLTNRRDDAYGGDVAGRARWPFEVIAAVRAAWPASKPLSVRLSATDWAPGGLSEEDLLAIARGLGERGVDLIDVSAGQTVPDQRPRYGRLFQTPFADLVRLETGLATMAVGAIATWEDASSVLIAGRADLVALARGHLWDPYFTRHAAHAQGTPLPWPAPYEALTRFNPNPGRRG